MGPGLTSMSTSEHGRSMAAISTDGGPKVMDSAACCSCGEGLSYPGVLDFNWLVGWSLITLAERSKLRGATAQERAWRPVSGHL